MDYVIYNGELYHYGVKGMKWGHRKRQAKAAYKKSTSRAFDEYERDIASIEKNYKRGQNLSKKDMDREAAVEKRYNNAVTKAKSDYKKAKQDIKAEKKQFKADVKTAKAKRAYTDIEFDAEGTPRIGKNHADKYRDSLAAKKGKTYADAVLNKADKEIRNANIAAVSAYAVTAAGMLAVSVLLGSD